MKPRTLPQVGRDQGLRSRGLARGQRQQHAKIALRGPRRMLTLIRSLPQIRSGVNHETVAMGRFFDVSSLLFDQLAETDKRIEQLTDEIEVAHERDETSQRLATIPGVGMLTATIIAATTPVVDNFDCARDYAAWLGLTPKPHSTGGRQRVGSISKMGNRYIQRLLYLGAMAQIMLRCRLKREPGLDWLSNMLIRKKTKVVAIALAHRMARTIFAVLRDGSRYEPQTA